MPAPAEQPAAQPTGPLAASDPFASELAATELLGASAIAQDSGTTSALESLFAEDKFRDYEAEPGAPQAPFGRARAAEATPDASPHRGEISRAQRILLGVAGGLVAVLALVALFLLGTRLPDLIGPAAAPLPSASPSPSPSASPTTLPVGPVEPGVWAWDELLGGECLADYDDPWAEEFTVVDCAEPHPAQLVYRGAFPPSAEGVTDDPFPGTEALQGQLALLCSAPGVLDLAAAGQFTDVQFQGSYPATSEQWDAGDRSYYCFVSRSSGEPLTGSLAVPPPAPAEGEATAG
ncbi:MAG: septum formation family protein [Protaetiibacter sp.]